MGALEQQVDNQQTTVVEKKNNTTVQPVSIKNLNIQSLINSVPQGEVAKGDPNISSVDVIRVNGTPTGADLEAIKKNGGIVQTYTYGKDKDGVLRKIPAILVFPDVIKSEMTNESQKTLNTRYGSVVLQKNATGDIFVSTMVRHSPGDQGGAMEGVGTNSCLSNCEQVDQGKLSVVAIKIPAQDRYGAKTGERQVGNFALDVIVKSDQNMNALRQKNVPFNFADGRKVGALDIDGNTFVRPVNTQPAGLVSASVNVASIDKSGNVVGYSGFKTDAELSQIAAKNSQAVLSQTRDDQKVITILRYAQTLAKMSPEFSQKFLGNNQEFLCLDLTSLRPGTYNANDPAQKALLEDAFKAFYKARTGQELTAGTKLDTFESQYKFLNESLNSMSLSIVNKDKPNHIDFVDKIGRKTLDKIITQSIEEKDGNLTINKEKLRAALLDKIQDKNLDEKNKVLAELFLSSIIKEADKIVVSNSNRLIKKGDLTVYNLDSTKEEQKECDTQNQCNYSEIRDPRDVLKKLLMNQMEDSSHTVNRVVIELYGNYKFDGESSTSARFQGDKQMEMRRNRVLINEELVDCKIKPISLSLSECDDLPDTSSLDIKNWKWPNNCETIVDEKVEYSRVRQEDRYTQEMADQKAMISSMNSARVSLYEKKDLLQTETIAQKYIFDEKTNSGSFVILLNRTNAKGKWETAELPVKVSVVKDDGSPKDSESIQLEIINAVKTAKKMNNLTFNERK